MTVNNREFYDMFLRVIKGKSVIIKRGEHLYEQRIASFQK